MLQSELRPQPVRKEVAEPFPEESEISLLDHLIVYLDNRRFILRFVAIGAEFFSPILGGAVAGYYLDVYFRTQPVMAVGGVFLGTALGFYRLFVGLRDFQKSL